MEPILIMVILKFEKIVKPLKSRTTGPAIAVDILMAGTPITDGVRFPVKTYVPGAVMLKGKEEILVVVDLATCAVTGCIGAACAVSALIIRLSDAVKSMEVRIIGFMTVRRMFTESVQDSGKHLCRSYWT